MVNASCTQDNKPKLGLGTGFSRSGIVTPGVVTTSLVMKHMYPAGAVQPLSDGAAFFAGSTEHIQLASAISNNVFSFHQHSRSPLTKNQH